MNLNTCVHPDGRFVYGLHRSAYRVANLRSSAFISELGRLPGGRGILNQANFPDGAVESAEADGVYEVANPFPFRGATYIGKTWADALAADPSRIGLDAPAEVSFRGWLERHAGNTLESPEARRRALRDLPDPILLALAATSTDPEELMDLARIACEMVFDPVTGSPTGLVYESTGNGGVRPKIQRRTLFDVVANNALLPDRYKHVMVLRPGAQGESEIVGEWRSADGYSHVYEYLRKNSYIAGGHYAANMADDCIRNSANTLCADDMEGMRHLYYQRSYLRMAQALGVAWTGAAGRALGVAELEDLRCRIGRRLACASVLPAYTATLWGWNLGFDFAPSRYRLHASHQQVHQQYALIGDRPQSGPAVGESSIRAFACGDLIADFIEKYRIGTGTDFFEAYLAAIDTNQRMDAVPARPQSLIVHDDGASVLFVPKAQTSQWELQLIVRAPVGNIFEADSAVRASLDRGILLAQKALAGLGARMVTAIEFSKRITAGATGQRLIYSFLPRLPKSPGAFSEAQLRWINGHYPEDFAAACRARLARWCDAPAP